MAEHGDDNLVGKKPPMTYRISDHPQAGEALERAKSELARANVNFRRVIDGVLVTEPEYQDWLARREGR